MPTKIQDPLEPFFRHGNKVLRDRIFSEDVVLRDKLISIWIAANEKLLSFVKGNRKQDIQHSLTVENNIGLILERFNLLEKMKAKDLFILSVSAAIHDIWKAMYSHDTMEKHGEKGKGTLLKEGIRLELQIDRRYVEAIANIISVHDTGDIDKLSSDPFLIGERPGVLLRGLAAIFRLADMLDTTYERYPDLIDKLYTGYQKKGMNTATRFVGGWDFSADNKNIVLQIISPHTKRQKLCVMALIDAMNADLAKSRSSLENCKIITNSGDIVTASLPTSFVLMNQEMKKEPTGLKEFYKTLLESYLRSLHKSERYVDLGGLGVFGERARPLLSKVYIRLKAQRCSGYPLPGPIAEYNRVILDYKKKLINGVPVKKPPLRDLLLDSIINFLPFDVIEAANCDKIKNLVILGHAGTGKSTIVQYLCLLHSKPNAKLSAPIPFKVVIRFFMSERAKRSFGYSLLDYIHDEVKLQIGSECPKDFVKYCLEEKEAIVIFDGLDEVANISDRKFVRDMIMKFKGSYPKARYLVTSRIYGYEEAPLGSDFLHVTLNSVSIDGVERFIHSWYDQREPDPRRRKEKQESFKTALKEETIRELASVPLILTIMALVNETGPLPRLRTELYETIVDAYIKNREKIRGVVWYDYNEVRAAHEYIAYWMHSRNEQIHEGVDAKTLETILLDFLQKTTAFPQSECLKKAEEFVRLARVRIGLIYEKRLGEFSFGLRPVQEFLAASYINSNSYSVEDLWNYVGKNITNPYWHDIIRFLGGIVGHNSKKGASIFLQKIISYNKAETFVLAAEIASEDILLEWGVREQISDKCLEALTKTSCLNEIQILAESILSLIGTEAKKHILDCLERIAFQDAIKGLNVFYKLALKYNQLQSKTKKEYERLLFMHVFEGWKKTGKLEDLVTELLGNLKPGVDLHKRRMSAEVLVAMSSEEFAKELVLRSISMLSQPHKTNVAMSLSAMGLLSDELKEALEGKFSRIKMKEQHA